MLCHTDKVHSQATLKQTRTDKMADIDNIKIDRASSYFPLGFHVSKKAWDWYAVSTLLVSDPSAESPALVEQTRLLATKMLANRAYWSKSSEPVHAGELLAMGLLHEIFRYLMDKYCTELNPRAMLSALDMAAMRQGKQNFQRVAKVFVDLFEPQAVILGEMTANDFLQGETKNRQNTELISSELILLKLSMQNPAYEPFSDLFDDADLKASSPYEAVEGTIEDYFSTQPPYEGIDLTLIELLRAPMLASPGSLDGQLDFIRERWTAILPKQFLTRLILAKDIMREEAKRHGLGPGPAFVLEFGKGADADHAYDEPERFTMDKDWMANVVLMAKTTYVWLDQLSKKHERSITRLDQIPDEELDTLARWGITGLWLIGIWERSPASQTIKQAMGNPEAAPSAYSLYDYVIAEDLGGESAYDNLRERTWKRGIRLASDMVPNHMGIHSKWVIEHPDWFVRLDHPPFPSYNFSGMNLSHDDRVTIQIEDGYWDKRDAAVVFKRIDNNTGHVDYIYHGNDGTSMPWNDTAQLNFLLPEVREAVIQTILHVARKFSVIRFDAAMTLAKKHYQRLWFPKPGDAGAIPSRAEHGLTRSDFDEVFPKEFWREVVDRIQAEVPDTLLIAEAFWLMEGYFVRTLGMHRVYNSAFMNMLKMQENSKYRSTVKNVLEFSPEILKRFVNFMNNPDELTAVEQFGKGDKYYGVAVMMVTMPGLPMFGHGQIEGLTEKYGMEYRKAYWDEEPDEHMIARHERQVFPLMRKRHLFSGVDNFTFYDFHSTNGRLDENVFAYSNRSGDERAIILFNNEYATTSGWINRSVQMNLGSSDSPSLITRTLAEALALNVHDDHYYAYRDHFSGLNYLRHSAELASKGMFAELHAYQCSAFLEFREIHDSDGSWGRLAARLGGKGVHDLGYSYKELMLEPIIVPFRALISFDVFDAALKSVDDEEETVTEIEKLAETCAEALEIEFRKTIDYDAIKKGAKGIAQSVRTCNPELKHSRTERDLCKFMKSLGGSISDGDEKIIEFLAVPYLCGLLAIFNDTFAQAKQEPSQEHWISEYLIVPILSAFQQKLGRGTQAAHVDATLLELLTKYSGQANAITSDNEFLRDMLDDPAVCRYLGVNEHEGVKWFSKERMEILMNWLPITNLFNTLAAGMGCISEIELQATKNVAKTTKNIVRIAEEAGYRLDKFWELMTVHCGKIQQR